MRLNGKIALVTGAAGGIGSAICDLFRAEGATVLAVDLQSDAEQGIAALDVTSESAWANFSIAVAKDFGHLDVLIHSAGISGFGPLDRLELADWHRFLDVNVTSAYLGSRLLMPMLREAPTASIIAIGSSLAIRPAGPLPAYAASKGALRNLIKSIALDCASRQERVRANCIHPGSTETNMMETNLMGDPGGRVRRMAAHPLAAAWHRLVLPDDVAKAALFLASDDSIFITGIDLPVDGGATI